MHKFGSRSSRHALAKAGHYATGYKDELAFARFWGAFGLHVGFWNNRFLFLFGWPRYINKNKLRISSVNRCAKPKSKGSEASRPYRPHMMGLRATTNCA